MGIHKINCWMVCKRVECSHTRSTCSKMKLDSSKSMQKLSGAAAAAPSHAAMSMLIIQSAQCWSLSGVHSKMRSHRSSIAVDVGRVQQQANGETMTNWEKEELWEQKPCSWIFIIFESVWSIAVVLSGKHRWHAHEDMMIQTGQKQRHVFHL